MTTGNTTLLGLALPVEGELDGTWGDVVNDSITSLVDSAVAGTTTLSADADVTLTTTVLAANQARQAILRWTASNGATTRNITAPAQSKPYIVINAGTGSIVLRGAGPTTGITIVAGERCLAAWSGSDFVKVASSVIPASSITGAVAIANGGTGQTTASAAFNALSPITSTGDLIIGNGTNSATRLAIGSNGFVLTSNGTTATWAASTGGVTSFSAGTTGLTPSAGTTGAITLAGTLAVANGGTGQTSYTDGQLLIGNTTGNTLTKATLTAGTGISITNGTGSITIATSGGGGGGTGSNIFLATNFGGF
jgi:hypothetical protein